MKTLKDLLTKQLSYITYSGINYIPNTYSSYI